MALNTTPYPNTIRTISGSAVAFADDVILLCDTSSGAVNITLQEIPTNNWNLLYKLFVIDNSNNASVNNITINAPSGQSINLGSSIVINTNGGGYVFEISGNGQYLGTPSSGGGGGGGVTSVGATSPLTSSGGATPNISIPQASALASGYLSSTDYNAFNSKSSPIAILNNVGGTVTTAATSIRFDTNLTTTNVAGAVTVSAAGGGVSSVGAALPLSSTGGSNPSISIAKATGLTDGYLAATDFNVFTSKGSPIAVINAAGTTITTAATSIKFDTNLNATAVGSAVTVTAAGGSGSTSVTAPITNSGSGSSPNIGITQSSGTTNGYLSSTDWTTFNNKVGSVGVTAPITNSGTSTSPTIGFYDSGWVNCAGFEHQASVTSVQRPQCRLVGNLLYFRGTAIVPLASDLAGTTYVPPSSGTLPYFVEPYAYVFQASSGSVKGCTIATATNGGKSISFNLNASILPPSISALFSQTDAANTGWKMYNRGVNTVGIRGTTITTIGKVELDKNKLIFYPYQYAETELTGDAGSKGTARIFTGMVGNTEVALDFTQIDNLPLLGTSISATHSTGTSDPNWSGWAVKKRSATSYVYQYDVISAEAEYIGGFQIELDGLIAFP